MTSGNEGAGLSTAQAEAIVRLVESAPQVRRRYQFFVWLQSHVKALLPHEVAVCGAWQRQHKALLLEPFHAVPVPAMALAQFASADGPLVQAMLQAWAAQGGRPVALDLRRLVAPLPAASLQAVLDAGLHHWLVHAVSRPYRPHELESLFLFAAPDARAATANLAWLELLLPHLHSTCQRMQMTEREMGTALAMPQAREPISGAQVTARERQILGWVREGMSNQQIGEVLDISALTVKNHVQKILRKLGAANRAQAVAKAMSMNLLPTHSAAQDA